MYCWCLFTRHCLTLRHFIKYGTVVCHVRSVPMFSLVWDGTNRPRGVLTSVPRLCCVWRMSMFSCGCWRSTYTLHPAPWLPSTKHTPAHPCTRPRYSVSRWGVNALLLRLLDKLPAAESVTGRSCVVLVKENTAINVTAAKPPPPILPRTSISTALQNINEIVALVLWRKVKCCNNSTPHLFYCFY